MSTNRTSLAGLELLHRAVRTQDAAAKTDGQLLEQFVRRRDEAAFAALVRRHGPMVLGVCRRVLGNVADAEDAFQATFIVLVRKAAALLGRPVLGDFLHGIARRTALKARTAAAHRRVKERAAARPTVQGAETRNDWLPLLDEELTRLPEKYRLPLVLCDLEGRTRCEAAGQLGWPEGTVATRLARGRALLAKRLLRNAQLFSAGLPGLAAEQAMPAALVGSTVQAAAAGDLIASAAALTLAKGVLQTMLWNKVKIVAVVILASALTAGVGGFAYRVAAGDGPATAPGSAATPQAGPTDGGGAPPEDKTQLAHEIDISDFQLAKAPLGSPLKPTTIAGVQELVTAIPNKELQTWLVKQVDFDKERLVFFAWERGPGDRLSFTTVRWASSPASDKPGAAVVFQYLEGGIGASGRVKAHYRLFALPKEVSFQVEEPWKERGERARELDTKDLKPYWPAGSATKPLTIDNAEALLKAAPDKMWYDWINQQTDFTTENVLVFAWLGRAGETVSFKAREDKGVQHVTFEHEYQRVEDGAFAKLTGGDVAYVKVFALPKNAVWTSRTTPVTKPVNQAGSAPPPADGKGVPKVAGDFAVKVLSAEATVELRGMLAVTPKGTFLWIPQAPDGAPATWELNLSKVPELEKQAATLSGSTVAVTGTCKMVWEAAAVPVQISGLYDPQAPERRWQLDKVVAVSKLTAAEKK